MSASLLDLCRSVPFASRAAAEPGDGQTLEGHAAVFGERTFVDSWEGTFWESIRKGAFRKTIRERTPVMQFDHGRHPLIGSIPIGAIDDLREDDEGLYVRGRLSDNWLIEPVRDAIREKSVQGMSFRFAVVREEWRDNAGKMVKPEELAELLWLPGDRGPLERTLIELRVPELGPVVFPAYAGTDVSVRARSIADDVLTDDELRREVRHALAVGRGSDDGLPADPELRREVARVVLFGRPEGGSARDTTPQTTPPAPPTGHPAGEPEEGTSTEDTRDTAPPERPSPPDAPPATGHPSPSTEERRAQYLRRAYLTREGVGKRHR